MGAKQFTTAEIKEILDDSLWFTVNKWLARGDGVAVYQNAALDSSDVGHRQFTSFGSKAAMLETAEPPTRLPDIGEKINWAYQLEGTYTGDALYTAVFTCEESDNDEAGEAWLFSIYADDADAAKKIVKDIQTLGGSRLERDDNFVYVIVYNRDDAVAELARDGYGVAE